MKTELLFMPILPKKTENRLPISTDVLINDIALTITRCTFQEYKMRYNINSDEFDDDLHDAAAAGSW